MKSVSDEFDVFDERAHRVVDVASVLASNAHLNDLLSVLQRERDQLDLLLDVTNAVVTQLDTRELFRAVAPALRRCCSADVAALSSSIPMPACCATTSATRPRTSARGRTCRCRRRARSTAPRRDMFSRRASRGSSRLRTSTAFPRARFIRARGIRSACSVPLATAHGILGTLSLGAFSDDAFPCGSVPAADAGRRDRSRSPCAMPCPTHASKS